MKRSIFSSKHGGMMSFVSKVSSSYELTCKGYIPKPEYWAFTCFFIYLKMIILRFLVYVGHIFKLQLPQEYWYRLPYDWIPKKGIIWGLANHIDKCLDVPRVFRTWKNALNWVSMWSHNCSIFLRQMQIDLKSKGQLNTEYDNVENCV